MIEGPLGGAAFNNEFGRPNLGGYFRVYEQRVAGVQRGYHKPIMIAGGLGAIAATQTHKIEFPAGTLLIQLGGPGMRIGMGGGAASSMAAGSNAAALDFDSVQRGNPEIQRRAQEVINHCWALGDGNPILAIHDVGAGGISNAFPELVDGAGRGAALRPAQGAARRERPGAQGDLVQREPGALRDRARPDALPLFEAHVRARALPVRRRRRGQRRSAAGARRRRRRRARRSTCRWTCCSASRRRCTATCSASRAREPPLRPRPASSWSRSPSTCCATRRWPASAS